MTLEVKDPLTGPRGNALPALGDYEHQPVVGPYRVDPGEAARDRTFFGLSLKATLCYGTFRDSSGNAYAALRKVGWESASALTLQTTLEGGPFRIHPAARRSFSGWGVDEVVDGDGHAYASAAGLESEPFRLEHRAGSAAWSEGALLSLQGHLVGGCGIQWYDPSPAGAFYASEQYRVSGSILGAPVDGFFAFDQLYLPPGVTWFEAPYFSSPPYLEVAWHTFATEFDDGTVEAGQVFFGSERMSFAAIVDQDGPAAFARDVTADIRATPSGYPSEIRFRIGDEPWRWTAEERWQMPDFSAGYPDDTYRPSEGLFVREDEHRTPRVWWSFIDCWTDRRGSS